VRGSSLQIRSAGTAGKVKTAGRPERLLAKPLGMRRRKGLRRGLDAFGILPGSQKVLMGSEGPCRALQGLTGPHGTPEGGRDTPGTADYLMSPRLPGACFRTKGVFEGRNPLPGGLKGRLREEFNKARERVTGSGRKKFTPPSPRLEYIS
jgi:hypothetical protein